MKRKFCLTISKDDLEGSLSSVIQKLTVLANDHGYDKVLELELGIDRGWYSGDSEPELNVWLKEK